MAQRTRSTSAEIERLAAEHPGLPIAYLNYMRDVGWREFPGGHMVYSGPILPIDIYPQLGDVKDRFLLGDDMQGFCLAYDLGLKVFGEFSDMGEWSNFAEDFDLARYLAGDAA